MTSPCSPEGRRRAVKVRSNLDGDQCVLSTTGAAHHVTVSTSYLFPIRVRLYWECRNGSVTRLLPYTDPVELDIIGGAAQNEASHEWQLRKSQGALTGPSQITLRVGWYKLLADGPAGKEALLPHPLICNFQIQ